MPDSDEAIQAIAVKQVPWLQAQGTAGGGRLLITELSKDTMTIRSVCELSCRYLYR